MMTTTPAIRHVAIIGAGMSGLFLAHRLREQGIEFTIYKKAHEVDGTWRENKYPGLSGDVPTSKFHFSFAPKNNWTHAFAPGPEIQDYPVGVADDLDLLRSIRFAVTITNADWTGSLCTLTTGDGELIEAQAVVFATGFFMEEHIPATAWAQDCDNWYRVGNSLPIVWPWYAVEHAAMFDEPSDGDLNVHSLPLTVGVASD
jgi:cation diffusion facilitator CzcD-associated flavoprotein CzcO